MLIALSFAEVASRFEGTGGPYLYTRAAFGRFPRSRSAGCTGSPAPRAGRRSSPCSSRRSALLADGDRAARRTSLLTAIVAVLAAINIRGIRQSSLGRQRPHHRQAPCRSSSSSSSGLFCRGRALAPRTATVAREPLGERVAAHLCVRRLRGGSGGRRETRDPQRTVPFALIMTIVIVTVVMTLADVVALGTLPGSPRRRRRSPTRRGSSSGRPAPPC